MGCRSGAQGSRCGKLETVPSETDEITVLSTGGDYGNDGRLVFKASLCCEDRSDLIPDLIEILNSLHLKTLIEILDAQRVFNPFIPSSPENTRKQPKLYRVFNPFITENHPRPTKSFRKKQKFKIKQKNLTPKILPLSKASNFYRFSVQPNPNTRRWLSVVDEKNRRRWLMRRTGDNGGQ
ncbi:hypothetical protein LR48_Vigan10g190800 [Vigna angularis]|uniref:Uncharacterized protein n=1 Tax=Phaseolus angularis TaxID=3914 RepID=A0A0L9VLU1_PHAAN|nr:hypothetical protein LR48_Vigan10g190800 [Vigna angularis]